MDTSITDYLSTIAFPELIKEKSEADCFKNFCQDYNLLVKSFELKLSPLSEESENNYLITALLETLAARESFLRHKINQLLHILLPTPDSNKKTGAKNQQLDEIIALFGMKRNFSVTKESKDKIYETDEDLKKRIASRLGILSKTGTKTAYTYTLLSLSSNISDVTINQKDSKEIQKNLEFYFLPKIEVLIENTEKTTTPESIKDAIENESETKSQANRAQKWFSELKPKLESEINQKAIIPIRDTYTLLLGKIIELEANITCTVENLEDSVAVKNEIKQTCRDYLNKKYKFNSVVSGLELLSYFNYPLIEKLSIKLKKISTNEKDVNEKDALEDTVLAFSANEAPLLKKIIINTEEYDLKKILEFE